jgi:hypothetical protein
MGNAVSVRVDDGEQICASCLDEEFISDRVIRFVRKPRAHRCCVVGIPCVAISSMTACQVRVIISDRALRGRRERDSD